MDIYHRKRLVSKIAWHVRKGRTWEWIHAHLTGKGQNHPPEEVEACRLAGYQCVENANLLQLELDRRRAAVKEATKAGQPPPVFPPLRLCDLEGCKLL